MTAITNINFETGINRVIDNQPLAWGFRSGKRGTHTSRTIMLEELSMLLDSVPDTASRKDYADAVLEGNCLGKRTSANRKHSFQNLSELYGLDARLILFRVMRYLWGIHESSRPLLGLLLALARDPLLRATAKSVIQTRFEREFIRQSMEDALSETVAVRLNDATFDKVVRNASSSWTQSGHFRGRGRKTRQRVKATPATTTFALLLGFATGHRGRLLFETPWAAILDTDPDDLLDVAIDAKRLGLLNLKQSGLIIDISFPSLMTEKERELIHGTYRQVG